MVWAIRSFRPDVVITRFPTNGDGGHGHHTASAILAGEAFAAAADPTRFPEQLDRVRPWQATRLFWNAWQPQPDQPPTSAKPLLTVDLGAWSPLLGESFAELAARARTMHKSQGFGAAPRRGTLINYLELEAGQPAAADPFEGIDTTWTRVRGGEKVAAAVAAAIRANDATHPERAVPALVAVLAAMDGLDDPWVAVKRAEAEELLRACLGLVLQVNAPSPMAPAGGEVTLTVLAIARSGAAVRLERVRLPFGGTLEVGAELATNRPLTREVTVTIPPGTAPSQPHWLIEPPAVGVYQVKDSAAACTPRTPPALAATAVLTVAGRALAVTVPVEYRRTDAVNGERVQPLAVAPPVLLRVADAVALFPDARARQLVTSVEAVAPAVSGTLRLRVPAGWSVAPESAAFTLAAKGDVREVTFTVTPPKQPATGTASAEATVAGATISRGLLTIEHPHIPAQVLFPPAVAKLVRADVAVAPGRIGYVMGPGDEVPAALRRMGLDVALLSEEALADADLASFRTIVVGVRAYDTRSDLVRARQRLMDYVAGGGTVVVQYNTSRELLTDKLGPYPFAVSRERITDETAPVTFTLPDHPLLTTPNRITAADFDGWVQERGLYYPEKPDPAYETPISSHDPGEGPLATGILFARHGKGVYIYTSLVFFRELPAGVPGAYRLFANLVAGGRSGA